MPTTLEYYEFDRFRLEPTERRLLDEKQEPVKLKPKEFDLLVELVRHSGQRLSKEKLMEAVWPDADKAPMEGSLKQGIVFLRKALGDDSEDQSFIETVRGHGYRFIKKVRSSGEPAGGAAAGEQSRSAAGAAAATDVSQGSSAFRSFFGEHVFESDVRLVFAYRTLNPDVTGDPFRTHHPTPRRGGVDALPEGVRSWVPFQDIHAAVYMTNVLFAGKVSGVKVIHDKDIDGDDFDFCAISFGLGFNGFTNHLADYCDERLFKIEWGESLKHPKLYTDYFSIGGVTPVPEAGRDDCIVARIVSRSTPGRHRRVSFVCAGRTAAGTAVAGYYLANDWPELLKLYEEHGKDLSLDSMVAVIRHKVDQAGARDYDSTGFLATERGKQLVHWARATGLG